MAYAGCSFDARAWNKRPSMIFDTVIGAPVWAAGLNSGKGSCKLFGEAELVPLNSSDSLITLAGDTWYWSQWVKLDFTETIANLWFVWASDRRHNGDTDYVIGFDIDASDNATLKLWKVTWDVTLDVSSRTELGSYNWSGSYLSQGTEYWVNIKWDKSGNYPVEIWFNNTKVIDYDGSGYGGDAPTIDTTILQYLDGGKDATGLEAYHDDVIWCDGSDGRPDSSAEDWAVVGHTLDANVAEPQEFTESVMEWKDYANAGSDKHLTSPCFWKVYRQTSAGPPIVKIDLTTAMCNEALSLVLSGATEYLYMSMQNGKFASFIQAANSGSATIQWEYYDSVTGWTNLTTSSWILGIVTFTPPANWTTYNYDGETAYWIRGSITSGTLYADYLKPWGILTSPGASKQGQYGFDECKSGATIEAVTVLTHSPDTNLNTKLCVTGDSEEIILTYVGDGQMRGKLRTLAPGSQAWSESLFNSLQILYTLASDDKLYAVFADVVGYDLDLPIATVATGNADERCICKWLEGALTFTGTLTVKPLKKLAGALTSSGTLGTVFSGGVTEKLLEGALTFIGALTKKSHEASVGSIAPAGSLVKKGHVASSGALTFVGALTSKTTKTLAGVLTFVGSLVKKSYEASSGALTSAGDLALQKRLTKALAGALTFTGALATRIGKFVSLSGALTFVGSVTKTSYKSLTGALTFIGVLIKSSSKAFSGSLIFTGILIKKSRETLVGSLSFTGSLVTKTLKKLAGGLPPTGEVFPVKLAVKVYKSLTGELTFTGTLRRMLPVYIDIVITLFSGRLTSIRKGANLAVTALSGRIGIVRMAIALVIRLVSGRASIVKKEDSESIDITLRSGEVDITKETKD